MAAENRHLIEQLQALMLKNTRSGIPNQNTSHPSAVGAPIPETALSEEVDVLDRELNASLAEFDEMLLKELDRIRAQSTPKVDALAQEAAKAAERLREKGIDIGDSQSSAASDAEPGQEPSDDDHSGPAKPSGKAGRNGDTESPTEMAGPATEGVEGERQKQSPQYDGSDDDIVARQLREAAEQETDPELKEKLWREYEAYKRGTQ